MEKIYYGIDAPKVIRNLIVIGIFVILAVNLFPIIQLGDFKVNMLGFIWMGLSLILT